MKKNPLIPIIKLKIISQTVEIEKSSGLRDRQQQLRVNLKIFKEFLVQTVSFNNCHRNYRIAILRDLRDRVIEI